MSVYEGAQIERSGEAAYRARTDAQYWNAVGPFGGWIAAVFVRCVRLEAGDAGDPLTLSVNFASAMEPGDFTVRVRRLRANRSTTFWSAELLQEKEGVPALCAFATLVFAARRETPSFLDAAAPAVEPPEDLVHRLNPTARPFLTRFDLRFTGGGMFPKVTDGLLSAWIRALDAREMDYETLTAICDTGLPHIFVRLRRPVPVSTVTMNIFYHATAAELAQVGDDFLLSASRMRNAGHGFFDASTEMWSRAGALLATTEQVVWFKVPDVPNPSA